jgi:hypothetical protein
MMYKFLFTLLGAMAFSTCFAQQYVGVMDQLFTVHSAGNVFVNSNSSSRNVIEVSLPAGATGYVYRVSAAKRDAGGGDRLSKQLKGIAPRQLVMEAALAQFAIEQVDAAAVDVFAFNNTNDVNYFMHKQDNSWRCCWYNMGVINTCFATAKCLGPTVYLGFRNNNLATPVNVHLEVVAIVDTAIQAAVASGYTILMERTRG